MPKRRSQTGPLAFLQEQVTVLAKFLSAHSVGIVCAHMEKSFDSTDRGPGDFVLFGLGFLGFVVGVAGVAVASPGSAVAGLVLLLVSVTSFQLRH